MHFFTYVKLLIHVTMTITTSTYTGDLQGNKEHVYSTCDQHADPQALTTGSKTSSHPKML